jgi:TRAP-type C4-dicarboxylate transport system permease small subunit
MFNSATVFAGTVDSVRSGVTGAGGTGTNDQGSRVTGIISIIVNILLFIIGAAAVIMIVIGGLKYVTSNGDQQAAASAKNTILYAVIGIIVAALAYAIVNFIISNVR